MKNNITTHAVRNGAMMTALTVIFMLMSLYVPLFSVIGMFLSGLPLAVLYIKDGLKPTICSAVVSVLILFAFTGSVLGVASLVISNGLPGIVAGICVKKKFRFFNSVLYTGMGFLLGLMFEFLIIKLFMGGMEQMFAQIFEKVQDSMLEIGKMLEGAGSAALNAETMGQTLDMIKNTFRLYFPSMVVIASLLSGYILFSVYVYILRRFRLTSVTTPPFCMLRAPRTMGNVTILFYIVSIFLSGDGLFTAAFLNVIYVLYAIIGFCGLSLIDFKLGLKIRKGAVRGLIYVLIIFLGGVIMPLVVNGCVIIGLLDSSSNYRKISSFNSDDFSDDRSGEV